MKEIINTGCKDAEKKFKRSGKGRQEEHRKRKEGKK